MWFTYCTYSNCPKATECRRTKIQENDPTGSFANLKYECHENNSFALKLDVPVVREEVVEEVKEIESSEGMNNECSVLWESV
jgi:hypothetical protein